MAETKKIDFKIKNSSIAEFDQILMDSISSTIPRKTNFYKENLSEFYGNKDPDNQKITAVKSARLLNKENQISLELIQNKIQPIVELRIKPDSYFKFKSGIFPIDITLDGINLRAIDSSDTSRLEKIKKNELDDKNNLITITENLLKAFLIII